MGRHGRSRSGVSSVMAVAMGALALAGGMTALSPGPAGAASSGSSAPGVTSNSITVGAISTLTGSLAADFAGFMPGEEAYFNMVNAQGGVNGRKINLAYNLDDGGSPSTFTSLARTLVDQDHVFAVTGISTYWFSPSFFRASGVPTYGYNVSGNWQGPPNLYGSNGSVQCYACGVPNYSYVVNQLKAKSVAILSYSVSSSSDACQTTANLFKRAGVNVSYEDFNLPIDGNPAPDVQRIQRAGSDFLLTCTDVDENISIARDVQQYGLKIKQLWLNGSDQSVLNRYSNLMQGVYFYLQNVPLTAPQKYYPGLTAYMNAMNKYEPQSVGESLAFQGWIAAALFVQGVKAAGSDLTQQRVIQLTNQITDFNGDGISAPTNWTYGHTKSDPWTCGALVKVQGKKLVTAFAKGHQVYTCQKASFAGVKNPAPIAAPPGTPGT